AGGPKAVVRVEAALRGEPAEVAVHVRVENEPGVTLRGRADLVVALVQDRLIDDVARGENRGRRLSHTAVVRTIRPIASVPGPDPAMGASTTLPIAPDWKIADLGVIAFLQERDSRRIVGAGVAARPITPSSNKENLR